MKKCVENLATSKITGGRRHPLRTRRKYETDRYPNEPINGAQMTITRHTRGKNRKTALKSVDFVNLSSGDGKVKKSKIIKVLDNATNNDYKRRAVCDLRAAAGNKMLRKDPGSDIDRIFRTAIDRTVI